MERTGNNAESKSQCIENYYHLGNNVECGEATFAHLFFGDEQAAHRGFDHCLIL